MSSKRLQDMSSRRTIFRLPRRLCKTSSRRLGRRKLVTRKTCWRRLQDMSRRPTMFSGKWMKLWRNFFPTNICFLMWSSKWRCNQVNQRKTFFCGKIFFMGMSVYHRGHLFYFRFKGTYKLFPDFKNFLCDPIWVLLKHFCRSLHLQRCSVREKGTVSQRFFWDIRKLNAFLYELFQNVSMVC